jgi:DNA-directed RNA polymerase subunit L
MEHQFNIEVASIVGVIPAILYKNIAYWAFKNKTNEIINVTTDDAKFYYEEKQVVSPYKVPVPLARLQPNQEIAFSAITSVGTEHMNAMYSAVCSTFYKEVNMNEFDFTIESRGQISEKRIMTVALQCIERRLKNFIKLLKDDKTIINEENNEGLIIINNEDHTLGNLISHGMTTHNKIQFAGYNLTHPRVAKVNFHYKHDKGAKIISIIEDVVDYYLEIFSEIKKQVDKL